MSDRLKWSEPEPLVFDHEFDDPHGCGYCEKCGSIALMHDEDALNRLFDWMETA